jgi:hypothetical protein
MNENELEIEKLKMKIQDIENEKKVRREIVDAIYGKDRVVHPDKVCCGLFMGATMGIPVSVISYLFRMEPAIGIIINILLIAFTGLMVAIIAEDKNPLLR